MKEIPVKSKIFMWYLVILSDTDSDIIKFILKPVLYYCTFYFKIKKLKYTVE